MELAQRVAIKGLLNDASLVDKRVVVSGWVKTVRHSKAGVSFVMLSDGSDFRFLQLVVDSKLANYNEVQQLTTGCSLMAEGDLVESSGAGQTVELQVTSLAVLGTVEEPEHYPITPKYHTLEYLRDFAHLRVRSNTISAVARVRHVVSMAIHRFFDQNGFYWVHTPIITTSDCEGAGQMFRVTTLDPVEEAKKVAAGGSVPTYDQDFFARESFLTVSGQLNVESYCCALGRVYTFGPTFRAENSNTGRHLAEFWMVEPEIAFADLNENAEWAVKLLKFIAEQVLSRLPHEMDFFAEKVDPQAISRLQALVESKVQHLDYTEAVKILTESKHDFQYPVSWGVDLQSEHERYLTEQVFKAPVVVKNYPKEIKSFYMRLNEDQKTVAAMDVLVPGVGEIIGGSQREERPELLASRIQELGMDPKAYQWYLDLRRFGTVLHSGFGLGLERMIMYVTGLGNIRDVIPFPRTPRHADF